jgi:prevent-host-death family protein
MKRIGIRELRQNASVYIRLVKAGETVEVTDRGEPVARLVPVPPMTPLERLRTEGKTVRSARSRDLRDIVPLAPPEDAGPTLTEVLLAMRDDDGR